MTKAAEKVEKIVVEVQRDPVTKRVSRIPEQPFYAGGSAASDDAEKIMTELPFDRFDPNQLPYHPWGSETANNFPTSVRQKLETVPLAMRALVKLTEMMYGEGIAYAKTKDVILGGAEPMYDEKIEEFMFDNQIASHWFKNQALEYLMFANAFSECEMNGNGEITGLWHKTAEFCRLSQQSKTTNRIEYILYSPDFQLDRTLTFADFKAGNYALLPLYRWYERQRFFSELRGSKFGFHTAQNATGVTYYARILWYALLTDKNWMGVAAAAPRQAYAMMQNQTIIKYKIEIPISYFVYRHPKWDSYTDVQRAAAIDKKIDEINKYLSGIDNNFKSFAYVCEEDENSYEKIGTINIEAIDDKVKTGTWIPDASVANLEILNALGLNPNQMQLANQQGKSMGAGSGSDARVGYNTHILNNTLDQTTILYPLNAISRFNNWGVTFFIKHQEQTTTNKDKSGLSGEKPKKTDIVKPKKTTKNGTN
jgi:hypothetical protein